MGKKVSGLCKIIPFFILVLPMWRLLSLLLMGKMWEKIKIFVFTQ
jgi:hypothetical protein